MGIPFFSVVLIIMILLILALESHCKVSNVHSIKSPVVVNKG